MEFTKKQKIWWMAFFAWITFKVSVIAFAVGFALSLSIENAWYCFPLAVCSFFISHYTGKICWQCLKNIKFVRENDHD